MNKLLMTGLSIANEFDLCGVCNYDQEWLIMHPSTFLWTDRFLVANTIWNSIQLDVHPDNEVESALQRSVKLIFEILNENGMIERYNIGDIFDIDIISNTIKGKVHEDIERLKSNNSVRIVDNSPLFKINKSEFCYPLGYSLYTSLLLSQHFGAQTLFDNKASEYLDCLISDRDIYSYGQTRKHDSLYSNVMKMVLPNEDVINTGVMFSKQCNTCKKQTECLKKSLDHTEQMMLKYLNIRDYDEVGNIRAIISRLVDKRNNGHVDFDEYDVYNDYLHKKKRLNKLIVKHFPKLQRFSNITTAISVPFALLGPHKLLPGVISGASIFTKQMTDYLNNKYKWINFNVQDIPPKPRKLIRKSSIVNHDNEKT